jgi:lipopolysaccharide export system protein LptC
MIYRLFAVLATLALIVGVVLLSGPQREPAVRTAVGASAHQPGYSATDARLVQTGPDGRPLYTLQATTISQQPGEDRVQLEHVQMGFRDTSGDQWTASADHGALGQDSGIVELDGNVHLAGVLPGTQDRAAISTSHLDFDTRAQIASTSAPVTLVMSGRTLSAQGLEASLKEGRVQLESAVHGSFLP